MFFIIKKRFFIIFFIITKNKVVHISITWKTVKYYYKNNIKSKLCQLKKKIVSFYLFMIHNFKFLIIYQFWCYGTRKTSFEDLICWYFSIGERVFGATISRTTIWIIISFPLNLNLGVSWHIIQIITEIEIFVK